VRGHVQRSSAAALSSSRLPSSPFLPALSWRFPRRAAPFSIGSASAE
jgi:hypothetical protein